MNNKEPGYVYILTNPSFREDWVKIGKSSRPVDVRRDKVINRIDPMISQYSSIFASFTLFISDKRPIVRKKL